MSDNNQSRPAVDYIMGVDLGQVQDYTAIGVIERVWGRWEVRSAILDIVRLEPLAVQYNIVHIERVPLGTSYPDIVEYVGEQYGKLPKLAEGNGHNELVVDATGVGRPVVQLMRQKGLSVRAVSITGGNSADSNAFGIKVPKRDLVGAVQVLMQSGQLKAADGLREGRTLVKELQNFKYKFSTAGNDTYGAWRENIHDDMVLAIAIALWWARRGGLGRVL